MKKIIGGYKMRSLKRITFIFIFVLAGLMFNQKEVNALNVVTRSLNGTKNIGYTVTYNANGGSVSPISEFFRLEYGTFPTPERTGYTFDGWYYNGMKIESNSYFVTESNHTLVAQWTPNTYILNFNANGGVCSTTNKAVTYSKTYGILPTPTRTGYNFLGWSTSKTESKFVNSNSVYTALENQTVYALWQLKTNNLKDNSGTDGSVSSITSSNISISATGNATDKSTNININNSKSKTETAKSNVKKGKVSLSWNKVKGASGYQIKYSTSKKFTKCTTKTYGKNKKKVTISNLTKGKTYYVKMRAYAKSGKKKVYSKWSTVIKKKAK